MVERHIRPGTIYTEKTPISHAVDLAEALLGETSTVEDSEFTLRSLRLDPKLPYKGGHQEYYYALKVLIALVAAGCASVTKVGRRHYFEIYAIPPHKGD